MIIDLHVHTIYSDGEKSPLEILKMCNDNSISTVAITDHGNILGAKKAIKENPYPNIKIIPGIELTAIYSKKGCNLHILGYNIDLENKELNNLSNAIMEDAERRVKSFIEQLKICYNISFQQKDIDEIFNSVGNIGRPDVAKLCVKYGYAKTVHEAFKKLLDPLEDKVEKRRVRPTAKDCIEYIQNAGGIACLAHPIELKKDMDELKEYIAELKGYGLKAVEVYQSKHTKEYSRQLLEIVNELGLLYSVGSDYHGPIVSPDIEIGSGKENNLNISNVSILNNL
ncbi:MAG: PHP domain-containing protein [Clostridiales bacterium]|nr:PHP domain-containing protein [Clostridiales bacterium]